MHETVCTKYHKAYGLESVDLSANLCSPFLRATVVFSKALTFLGLDFSICKMQTINIVISEPSPTKHCCVRMKWEVSEHHLTLVRFQNFVCLETQKIPGTISASHDGLLLAERQGRCLEMQWSKRYSSWLWRARRLVRGRCLSLGLTWDKAWFTGDNKL